MNSLPIQETRCFINTYVYVFIPKFTNYVDDELCEKGRLHHPVIIWILQTFSLKYFDFSHTAFMFYIKALAHNKHIKE